MATFQSHISPAEHSGFRRKEVFCYWRSLAALSATTVSCFGVGLWSLIQRTENCWRRWPCAQPSGQQSLWKPLFFFNSQHTGRGQRVAYTLRHINQQGIDQMSPPTGLHYHNSMHRRLLEKGRPQNNTEYMKCPPFLHMESSSLRCQDKTWEQHLSLETSRSDSLFHGTEKGGGHCNKSL